MVEDIVNGYKGVSIEQSIVIDVCDIRYVKNTNSTLYKEIGTASLSIKEALIGVGDIDCIKETEISSK